MDLHVFPFPIPTPTSLPIPSLWVFPVHQPRALVSCIQPGLVIRFTLDNVRPETIKLLKENIGKTLSESGELLTDWTEKEKLPLLETGHEMPRAS